MLGALEGSEVLEALGDSEGLVVSAAEDSAALEGSVAWVLAECRPNKGAMVPMPIPKSARSLLWDSIVLKCLRLGLIRPPPKLRPI